MKTVAFLVVLALWLMLWLGFIYFNGFKNCFWFCSVIFSKLTKLNITTPDEKHNNNGCPDEEISSEMLTILQSHLTISLTLSLSLSLSSVIPCRRTAFCHSHEIIPLTIPLTCGIPYIAWKLAIL